MRSALIAASWVQGVLIARFRVGDRPRPEPLAWRILSSTGHGRGGGLQERQLLGRVVGSPRPDSGIRRPLRTGTAAASGGSFPPDVPANHPDR